MKIMLCTV